MPFRQVFTGSHSFTLIAVVGEIYSFSSKGLSVILPFGRTSYCDKDFALLNLLNSTKLTKVQHSLLFLFSSSYFLMSLQPLKGQTIIGWYLKSLYMNLDLLLNWNLVTF